MKTFKQFIAEEVHAQKIADAPEWAPQHAQKHYKIGKVTFSARDGLGSVPFNQSVYYHGFVAEMRPSTFLRLALPHDDERVDAAKKLVALVEEGYALGIPFLDIDLDDERFDAPKIKGHEGRGRMLAVQMLNGDSSVPVHVILRGGMRSHHITPHHIEQLKEGVISEGPEGRLIISPFRTIYVNGKKV